MLPRWVELMLMALGAWLALVLVVASLLSCLHLILDWRAERRRRRLLVENLIYASRTGSRWILVDDPKGRG